jgi:hypothetical protein
LKCSALRYATTTRILCVSIEKKEKEKEKKEEKKGEKEERKKKGGVKERS